MPHFYDKMLKLYPSKYPLGVRPLPESRFHISKYIGPLIPISLFLFGFTSYINVHWFGQMVALYLFGFGIL